MENDAKSVTGAWALVALLAGSAVFLGALGYGVGLLLD